MKAEQETFALYWQVLKQKREDKNKVYSLHEPHIYCMAKGKLPKRYEFGTKASIAKTVESNIIVEALAFKQNDYDGHTLPAVLSQVKRLSGLVPDKVWTDREYRGKQRINDTKVMCPKAISLQATKETREYLQKQFRKRAGIEGITRHLKSDHKLCRTYLKGFVGDKINVSMAAAAFNFRKWLRTIIFWFQFLLVIINRIVIMKSLQGEIRLFQYLLHSTDKALTNILGGLHSVTFYQKLYLLPGIF